MIASAVVIFTTKDNRQYQIPCHRHADAFYIISQFLKVDEIDKTKTLQGFLDENGNFLNRIEARKHAFEFGQVQSDKEPLFSEDMW